MQSVNVQRSLDNFVGRLHGILNTTNVSDEYREKIIDWEFRKKLANNQYRLKSKFIITEYKLELKAKHD
jgi:hypothetical protein